MSTMREGREEKSHSMSSSKYHRHHVDQHIIEVKQVSMEYHSEAARTEALKDISFNVKEGEFFTLIGPSGCGKSTLLNIIGGLAKASAGDVFVYGERVDGPNPRKIAIVFQEYTLYPWKTAIRNVDFGLELMHVSRDKREQMATKYIELVGLKGFEDAHPHELSGGMKQRIAMARALCLETPILLMDEPFGALDEQTRMIMGDELLRIWAATRKTIIFVTHSLLEAAYLSDRIAVLTARPGKIKVEVRVEVPRPRSSQKLEEIRQQVWEQLKEESTKAILGRYA